MKQFKKLLATTLLWFALGALTIPLIGCASTGRANTKATEAVSINSETGMPVWIKYFEEWSNRAQTTASKTTLDSVQASEKRNADGSSSYNLNADGVSTSPELQLANKVVDAALSRAGFGPPLAGAPPSEQVTISLEEYNRLLQLRKGEGTTTDGPDPGDGPDQPFVALTARQFQELTKSSVRSEGVMARAAPNDPGVSSAPSSQFSPAEFARLREFLDSQPLAGREGAPGASSSEEPPAPPPSEN